MYGCFFNRYSYEHILLGEEMIIGLTGYAQSGKDTIANILIEKYGYTRVAFADKIREYLYESNPMVGAVAGEHVYLKDKVDREGWDEAKKSPDVRRILQTSGVAARKVFGDNHWIIEVLKNLDLSKNYVITDVRFINEAELIKALGAQLWRIKRQGVDAVNGHISEHELDDYKVDQIFTNNGTLEDIENLVSERITKMGVLIEQA